MMTGVIQYKGLVPSELTKREWNSIMRDGFHQLGVYWVANYRSKHFTNAGGVEYGYAPRDGERGRPGVRGFRNSYTGRKLRKKGHTRPLVWSGKSEYMTRAARVSAYSAAGGTRSGVNIRMRAPALNFRKKNIDMRAELTRISSKEQIELTRLLGRYISSRIRRYSVTRTVPINGGSPGGSSTRTPSAGGARDARGRFIKKAA